MSYKNLLNSVLALLAAAMLPGCATSSLHSVANSQSNDELKQQVINTERAFARTMADRDYTAFKSFISDEAIFFAGDKQLHGKQEIIEWWKDFYAKPEAPFSWEPLTVEVLPSGTLALSTGPVHNAQGKLIGEFSSVWRQDSPGKWHIIFDRGNPVCN